MIVRETQDLAASPDLSVLPAVGDILLPSPGVAIVFITVALAAGYAHWHFSTNKAVERILRYLGAERPDDDDRYHQRFRRIVEEVSVAAGGMRIASVILPFSSLNAFSVADFRGTPVIGVTEGLLACLNREELETVVGHECAHLVSNDALLNSAVVSLFDLYGLMLRQGTKRLEQLRGKFTAV